jgi:hypothetical protein
MKLTIKQGNDQKIISVFISDSSQIDGSGLPGLIFSSTGLVARYKREGQTTWTNITLVNATIGTWASGGFKEDSIAGGWYELGLPNAVIAAGASWVVLDIRGAADMAPLPIEIQLVENTEKDIFDRIGAPVGASISADIAAIPTTKTGYSLSAAGIKAIWDQVTSTLTVAGSIGKVLVDNINAAISSRSSSSELSTHDTDIKAKLPSALIDGRIDANLGAINNSITAAQKLALSTGDGLVTGAIVTGFTPTLTQFKTNLSSSVDDFYNGHLLYFTDGSQKGQIFEVADYDGATKVITITASTGVPEVGDNFILG